MPLVHLSHINKVYELDKTNIFQALKDVNLSIDKGEFVAITGPSGSGKSTLMNLLGLLDKPSSGSYDLDGHDVAHLKEATLAELRNKKIGFVFQNFNLLARTSALENVALPLIYAGVSRTERLRRAESVLKELGLGDKLQSTPSQLSGGQQQRVAIARALVTNPEVLLADEPTGNLDSKTGAEMIELFHSLHKKGRTIILITHDPAIANNAKRVIKVKDGEIVK
ncbi:macrolide ABC transporter ATP-binding protein [Candidatus Daviesbacteria bacterium RIFCSPHIGHO2_01_FULL_44_29]|uniref:Macrolide ABC transporter ATP-binding protein n=1 Tax=Candidatus Daviesbacteria bacterium RIFCSPHIGHO2_02_FULL_43_12 TaxID=1797776 RepID=A0A1F5KKC1_9BACT|nr:MAG: macrolide ABC transporter ATP-binding protein [Candidatus Daviesbacteria bacterium RIFCSPHIGHO2_01_FULL_44_29]OGE40776.1 MAG: macrolide ABC transporter ATP-binding protein [Candidatus Daviesbacteria bacterium RIFCSPHIGHO2_12_FULL_47_45]OGE41373.1 MAG: macrolide ABC transporter ATP-binding protein [Candidatus Daviesbacteria bacterium RIFCSPHIGHO2_02_FULL_43_12]OGE69574.1 MAG: macrolide ABC transporter ATP-binding protein [Candidatus Daviesbacteria bacterium RIFCSPLOWO2_01_FULL_43_15]